MKEKVRAREKERKQKHHTRYVLWAYGRDARRMKKTLLVLL